MISGSKRYTLILTFLIATLITASLLFIYFQQDMTTGINLELEGSRMLNEALPRLYAGQEPEDTNIRWIGIYSPRGELIQQIHKAPIQLNTFPDMPLSQYENGYILARPFGRMMQRDKPHHQMPVPRKRPEAFIVLHFVSGLYDYSSFKRISAVLPFLLISVALITTLLILLKQIKKYQIKEQQNASLIELGMASRTLAHEIKNPLATIKAQSGLLRHFTADDNSGDISESLEIINTESSRIALLIDKMRELASPDNGRPEEILILDELNSILKGGLIRDFSIDCYHKKPVLYFDKSRFHSIFRNLIQNSLEAGADNIHIEIQVKKKHIDIDVQDNGCGISLEERSKVLLPFYTNKISGSGIGLALIKSYVMNSGGKVKIKDSDRFKRGTSIQLSIPRNKQKEQA